MKPATQINRGRTRFCDVGHVLNETAQRYAQERRLFTEQRPRPSNGRFIVDVITHYTAQPSGWGNGTYALGLAAYSANARPIRARFLLQYAGGFATPWDPAIGNDWAGVQLRPISKEPQAGFLLCEEALRPRDRL